MVSRGEGEKLGKKAHGVEGEMMGVKGGGRVGGGLDGHGGIGGGFGGVGWWWREGCCGI